MIDLVNDSFAAIKSIGDCTFDHTITDPPYTPRVHKSMRSGSRPGSKSVPNAAPAYAPLPDGLAGSARHVAYAPLAPGYEWIGDLLRVSKRWVIAFCALESLGHIEERYPDEYVRGGVWLKPNSMGQLTGDRPAAAYEGIAILHRKGRKAWNGRGSFGVWRHNSTRGEDRCTCDGGDGCQCPKRHPQQKPLDLCLALVSLFTDVGETIFDPFAGSARIGQAAMLLDRHYLGFDSDPYWVAEGARRVEHARTLPPVDDEIARRLCRAFDPPRDPNLTSEEIG